MSKMSGRALDSTLIEPLALAKYVAVRLGEIGGVTAVALGGSRARGNAGESSDVDLGIFYNPSDPPSVERLQRLARELHSGDSPSAVSSFGDWGPWVNGGAWLQIQGLKLDWIYRDLERVASVIEDCAAGIVTCDYHLGHPHGFHNHIYLAEVFYCQPLFDPAEGLGQLKERVRVYPAPLKRALVEKFLYDADFMLELAWPVAPRGDIFHVSGCLFRCVAALVQVLFALNERYFMNEKGAVNSVDAFSIKPHAFSARVQAILGGLSPASLRDPLAEISALLAETRLLAKDTGFYAA